MLKRRQPALYAALSLAAGIMAGPLLSCTIPATAPWAVSGCALLLTSAALIRKLRTPCLLLLLFLTGVFRWGGVGQNRPACHVSHKLPTGERIAVHGTVIRAPLRRSQQNSLLLKCDSLLTSTGCQAVQGRLQLRTDSLPPAVIYGSVIWATGQASLPSLPRNPGAFDARRHYQRQHIFHFLKAEPEDIEITTGTSGSHAFQRKLIYPLRRRLREALFDYTDSQAAPLLSALLLGDRSALAPDQRDTFARAGIIHLLAVSGLHVGFILLILQTLTGLCRLSRPLATLFICLGLIFYVLLTESQIPVTRAAIMGVFYTLGRQFERMPDGLNLLGLAAISNLLLRPLDLFAPGFQLSFSAVLGILILLPQWRDALKHHCPACFSTPFKRWTIIAVLASMAAQMATLPLTLYHFHRVPLLSLPLNLLAIPWVSLLLPLSLATAVLGPVAPSLAACYGALSGAMTAALCAATEAIASLSFSNLNLPPLSLAMTLAYLSLLALTLPLSRRQRFLWTTLLLIGLNLSVWPFAVSRRFDVGQWIQFDVGQGDAALVTLPRGRHILIDGGDSDKNWDNGARVILPYLHRHGIRRLQGVVLSHDHNDHLGGLLSVLNALPVDTLYSPLLTDDTPRVKRLKTIIANRHIPHHQISTRCTRTCPGAKLEFFPADTSFQGNNSSLALRISLGTQALLFTGDLEAKGEEALIQQGDITAQAVKVPHHGSNTSSTPSLIRSTQAHMAVVSVGAGNRFKHPSPRVLTRWSDNGAQLFRTDRDGALCFTIYPDTIMIKHWQ